MHVRCTCMYHTFYEYVCIHVWVLVCWLLLNKYVCTSGEPLHVACMHVWALFVGCMHAFIFFLINMYNNYMHVRCTCMYVPSSMNYTLCACMCGPLFCWHCRLCARCVHAWTLFCQPCTLGAYVAVILW